MGEKVDNIARYKCLACSNERKGSDMVTFADNDYDFDHAIIKYTFLKHGRKIFDNRYYVCNNWYYYLWKEKGKEPKFPEKNLKIDQPDVYFCTCCHQEKESRKQIVYFKSKNYDFDNKVVSNALAQNFCCTKSRIEYIVKYATKCCTLEKVNFLQCLLMLLLRREKFVNRA